MKKAVYIALTLASMSFIGSYVLYGAAGTSVPTLTERVMSYIPSFLIPDMGERGESAEDLYADVPMSGEVTPSIPIEEGDEDYIFLEQESPIAPLQTAQETVLFLKNSTPFNLYVVYLYEDSWTSQVVDHGTLVPLGLTRKIDVSTIRIKTYGKYLAMGAKNYSLARSRLALPENPASGMVCIEVALDESTVTRYVMPYVFRLIDQQPPRYTTLAQVFSRAYNKLPYKEQVLGSVVTQAVGELTAAIAQNIGESIKQGAQAEIRKALFLAAQSRHLAYALLGSPWANSEYYRYHDTPVMGPKMKANIEAAYQSRFDSLSSGLWVDLADDPLVEDVRHILLLATRTLLSTTEIIPTEEQLAEEEDLARRVNERLLLYDPNRAPHLRVEQ